MHKLEVATPSFHYRKVLLRVMSPPTDMEWNCGENPTVTGQVAPGERRLAWTVTMQVLKWPSESQLIKSTI